MGSSPGSCLERARVLTVAIDPTAAHLNKDRGTLSGNSVSASRHANHPALSDFRVSEKRPPTSPPAPTRLADRTCHHGRRRPLHRGLVQPAPPLLFAWLPQPQPIRTEVFLEPGSSRVINPSTFSREGH